MRLGSGMRLTPLAGFRRVLGYSRRGACGMVASVCVLGMHIKLSKPRRKTQELQVAILKSLGKY